MINCNNQAYFFTEIKHILLCGLNLIEVFLKMIELRLLIAYGSLGKLFHLKEFADELEKQNVHVKLVKDTD